VFAGALVLSAEVGERAIAKLAFDVSSGDGLQPSEARAANAALVEGNAMSNGLPLFEALADGVPREVVQALAPQFNLRLQVTPVPGARSVPEHLVQGA
jgi:hypothetical protein